MKTDVLFVYPKYPDGQREVLALFPKELYNEELYGKEQIVCYMHVGQHGSAHRSFLKRARATKEQYRALSQELRSIGYKLNILN
jgi:hypothetical protein